MEQEALKLLESKNSHFILRKYNTLSPYFCFRYLYDLDESDNWTCYNDIINYLKNQGIDDLVFIENEFIRAMKDRNNTTN
jgi:hypothetical protein